MDETTESELGRLTADYGREWRVRRSYGSDGRPRGWVATRVRDDDLAPTVHADTLVELERQMQDPGLRAGRHLSQAQRDAILAELADPDIPIRPWPVTSSGPQDEDGIPVSWRAGGHT
ncbi:hypothetical protein ACFO4E_13945 [Nocardiopsis mangrovi]|uniref:Uncharacterized protein n=1 Tax=Nocardiopsis mangrovi TaxID=1179818 RepID=A0ABV9DW05_9ACTN